MVPTCYNNNITSMIFGFGWYRDDVCKLLACLSKKSREFLKKNKDLAIRAETEEFPQLALDMGFSKAFPQLIREFKGAEKGPRMKKAQQHDFSW